MKKYFDGAWATMAALASAPAFIYVIQNLADIRLSFHFVPALEFYRQLIDPVFGFVETLVPWFPKMPAVLYAYEGLRSPISNLGIGRDLHVLSIVGASLHLRAHADTGTNEAGFLPASPQLRTAWIWVTAFVSGIIGLGLLMWVSAIWSLTKHGDAEMPASTKSTYRKMLLGTGAAVVLFYLANQVSLIVIGG